MQTNKQAKAYLSSHIFKMNENDRGRGGRQDGPDGLQVREGVALLALKVGADLVGRTLVSDARPVADGALGRDGDARGSLSLVGGEHVHLKKVLKLNFLKVFIKQLAITLNLFTYAVGIVSYSV